MPQYESHIEICQFDSFACDKKCGFEGKKRELNIHQCKDYLIKRIRTSDQQSEEAFNSFSKFEEIVSVL